MSNSKTNELFILVNMEFMSKIFTIIYMALGLASWWCHCWMYTGVTFVIAVRTLCSPTTTPSDLSSPLRVHQPYAGPTYKLQLFILYWTTCTLRPGKGIMSSWRFVKWSIHKRNAEFGTGGKLEIFLGQVFSWLEQWSCKCQGSIWSARASMIAFG